MEHNLIIPLLKPNKDSRLGDSYRPITLISCFATLFENLLTRRLECFLEGKNILPQNITGFIKNSVQHGLKVISLSIQNAFVKKKRLCCLHRY